jgi:hypothetical protein
VTSGPWLLRHRWWRDGVAAHLGLRPDDPPSPAGVGASPTFLLAVTQTGSRAEVAVSGVLDDRTVRWLQEVVLDLIAAGDIVDVDVDLRSAHVEDGAALARVATVTGTFAAHRGLAVTGMPPSTEAGPHHAAGAGDGALHPLGRSRGQRRDGPQTGGS